MRLRPISHFLVIYIFISSTLLLCHSSIRSRSFAPISISQCRLRNIIIPPINTHTYTGPPKMSPRTPPTSLVAYQFSTQTLLPSRYSWIPRPSHVHFSEPSDAEAPGNGMNPPTPLCVPPLHKSFIARQKHNLDLRDGIYRITTVMITTTTVVLPLMPMIINGLLFLLILLEKLAVPQSWANIEIAMPRYTMSTTPTLKPLGKATPMNSLPLLLQITPTYLLFFPLSAASQSSS